MQISLIVPTYGRYIEIEALLESFTKQDFDKGKFEVILVDQNDNIDLSPIVSQYVSRLNLLHYKTSVKGIANAKNKGLELSTAPIVTFPDDDCTYYPDTISAALNFFFLNPHVDVVYGKIFDRNENRNVMRNWSDKEIKLNLLNFSLNYSAITCFTKLKIRFDENFGVGSKISSGEELDYIIRAINQKYLIIYSPQIQMWHPELNVKTMKADKVYNYAYGFGAIIRKNINLKVFFVFTLSLTYQISRFLLHIFSKDRSKYFFTITGRLKGFFKL